VTSKQPLPREEREAFFIFQGFHFDQKNGMTLSPQVLARVLSSIARRLRDCSLEDWGLDSATDFSLSSPEVRHLTCIAGVKV
jgi:hypothetical protein